MITAVAALLVAAAVLLGGCVAISDLQLNGGMPAGSNHVISMKLTAASDAASAIRGVIAVRVPSAWTVKSVSFSGALNGSATESPVMENIYSTEWETTAGLGHNGHKAGYKWWVGYTQAGTWTNGQASTATIAIDTNGRGGTYLLDFATGIADKDDPGDVVNDKSYWQIGSAGATPTGVLLDQPIRLYCFTDVTPGTAYFGAVQGMGAMGLIRGYPTGTGGYYEFRPTNSVLRAQYAKMIDGALGLRVDEAMAPPVSFTDLGTDVLPGPGVIDSLYPHEYVWVAYSNSIMKGYPDMTFKPYSAISRGQVVTTTVRALLNLHPDALKPVPAAFVQTWGNDLLPEHKANARIAEYNNLLAGLPLTTTAANGNAPMPRGEVAQVLWNMMGLIAP